MADKNVQSVARTEKSDPAEIARDALVPPVDIYEDQDSVTLLADLPGVAKDGLDVHIDKDTLQISGSRTAVDSGQVKNQYTEFPMKDYYRAFTIGDEIDRDKISAQMNSGVLKVVLPKAEKAKPKKINIKIS